MEARSIAPEAQDLVKGSARVIRRAKYLTAFTGTGISVESVIAPFRRAGGLWNTYDPRMLELTCFLAHTDEV